MVLVGIEYWSGLLDWMRRETVARGLIEGADLDLMGCTDDMAEACEWLTAGSTRRAAEAEKAFKHDERSVGEKR